MILEQLPQNFTICQISPSSLTDVDFTDTFVFLSRTDEELSLVCETSKTPANTRNRDDGWRAFRIQGPLNFSLTGILSSVASLLAQEQIAIFAVSTYNTDYILVKQPNFKHAMAVLYQAGHTILESP